MPYSISRGYDSPASYSSSIDNGLSRSLSHPRSLLQSPFSSKDNQDPHIPSSFEDYATRHRSNTLPIPLARPNFEHNSYSPHLGLLTHDEKDRQSGSPILPPIRDISQSKNRTYSVESILNEPIAIRGSPFSEHVILE